jgi:hypothetical protein
LLLVLFSILVGVSTQAAAQDEGPLAVKVVPGKVSLPSDAMRTALSTALGRNIDFVESLPEAGTALLVTGKSVNSVEVRYRASSGAVRGRTLTVSPDTDTRVHEIAILAKELTSEDTPPSTYPVEIEGEVHAKGGAPIAEARLTLRSGNGSLDRTDTDQAGRFRLPSIPPGSYGLEVEAPGYASLRYPLDDLRASQRGLVLELAPASETPPEVALSLATPGKGHEIEGIVRDSDGIPVPEARLVLRGNTGVAESTDTDQQGRFRLPDVPSGTYTLDVEAIGFATLHYPVEMADDLHGLELQLEPLGGGAYHTLVQTQKAPLPAQDATTTSTLFARDIENLPGGTSQSISDVIATSQGVVADNYGAVHVRGNFAGLQLRIDGVQLPPAIQDRLQQLIEPQIVEEMQVIVGGLPAEYGEDVAGVIDIKTKRPEGPFRGDAQVTYGTYQEVQVQANAAGSIGPVHVIAAGSLETSQRGLDPPAASPILHDDYQAGKFFLRADTDLAVHDRLELLAVWAGTNYQIPIDPTIQPLSDGPVNAVRGMDQYGNLPSDFVPYNSNPTELEREFFVALSWFHDFDARTKLQVTPFFRIQQSILNCDTVNQLGPTADPGQACSDVNSQVIQGGLQVNESLGIGINDIKFGLLFDAQKTTVNYAQFIRDDSNPAGGADPSQTINGNDVTTVLLGGIYIQDKIALGKLTLFPGLRLDLQHAQIQGEGTSSLLWGPSVRFGAAYAFTERLVLHAYAGILWQPPTYDAPTAARVLGLVPPDQPIALDLHGETDFYTEIGIADRIIPQLTVSLTVWGRLSQYTLDDNEVGDTALTADYNYEHGHAAGVELAAQFVLGRNVHAFGNLAAQIAEGEGIASSLYLFTPEQLAFTGYQSVDNTQKLTANVGVDIADNPGNTHLDILVKYGSGLRTGPTNNATLPPSTVVNATLRHRFVDVPLKPEVAFDVYNLFDVIYAYRIATGSLTGTAYGSLRSFDVRLIIPFGS